MNSQGTSMFVQVRKLYTDNYNIFLITSIELVNNKQLWDNTKTGTSIVTPLRISRWQRVPMKTTQQHMYIYNKSLHCEWPAFALYKIFSWRYFICVGALIPLFYNMQINSSPCFWTKCHISANQPHPPHTCTCNLVSQWVMIFWWSNSILRMCNSH